MEKYEFTGDWMSLTVEQFIDLLRSAQALNGEIICNVIRRPAIKKLNFELLFPDGAREICVVEIIPGDENGEAEVSVMTRLFSVQGNTAIFEFVTVLSLKDGEWTLKGGFAPGRRQDQNRAERFSFQHLFAFCLIQYLMLHGAEKVSFHKEYRKALKPSKASRLVAPYTQPGKVRVLDISVTEDEVREYVRRENAVHTWHCQAWGVRGHYRHYKTGRVSYVRPYVKGKNKAAYAGREYALPDGAVITEVMR